MDKAVREGLPDCSMQECVRYEDEQPGDLAGWPRSSQGRQVEREERNQVHNHQATSRAAEFGERKRGGANPWHDSQQVNPFNM